MHRRNHKSRVCHWTRVDIPDQSFGITRAAGPMEVPDECSFPAHDVAPVLFLAMAAPNSPIRHRFRPARSFPCSGARAERRNSIRYGIHLTSEPFQGNDRQDREPHCHRDRRQPVYRPSCGAPAIRQEPHLWPTRRATSKSIRHDNDVFSCKKVLSNHCSMGGLHIGNEEDNCQVLQRARTAHVKEATCPIEH